MENKHIEPCPFCGSPAFSYSVMPVLPFQSDAGYVECAACTAIILAHSEDEAVEAWNSRVSAPVVHGRWKDNHCTVCGVMPMGNELWTRTGCTPPRMEWFMDYCPICGKRMDVPGGNLLYADMEEIIDGTD